MTIKREKGLLKTRLTRIQEENTKANIAESAQGRSTLNSKPRRIILELTNVCNLNCKMCGRNFKRFKPSHIDYKTIKKAEPLFQYAEEATLFGWGEPTIYKNWQELARMLSKYPYLRKYILTNGTRIEPIKMFSNLCTNTFVGISLDGARPETNDKIRGEHTFKQIMALVRTMNRQDNKPYLNYCFTIMAENMHELPNMVRLCKETGVPELKGVFLTSFTKETEANVIWGKDADYKTYKQEATRLGKELGVSVRLPPVPTEDWGVARHRHCDVAWRDLLIGSDGYLRPCMHTPYRFCNLAGATELTSAWNCKGMQEFRKRINTNSEPPVCRVCYQSSHAIYSNKYAHVQNNTESIPAFGEQESR